MFCVVHYYQPRRRTLLQVGASMDPTFLFWYITHIHNWIEVLANQRPSQNLNSFSCPSNHSGTISEVYHFSDSDNHRSNLRQTGHFGPVLTQLSSLQFSFCQSCSGPYTCPIFLDQTYQLQSLTVHFLLNILNIIHYLLVLLNVQADQCIEKKIEKKTSQFHQDTEFEKHRSQGALISVQFDSVYFIIFGFICGTCCLFCFFMVSKGDLTLFWLSASHEKYLLLKSKSLPVNPKVISIHLWLYALKAVAA